MKLSVEYYNDDGSLHEQRSINIFPSFDEVFDDCGSPFEHLQACKDFPKKPWEGPFIVQLGDCRELVMPEKAQPWNAEGVLRIAAERRRQIQDEGHRDDNQYKDGVLSMAAVCYAAPEPVYIWQRGQKFVQFVDPWPWDPEWDKRDKHSRLRRLEIAGALIAAEIDRHLEEHGNGPQD